MILTLIPKYVVIYCLTQADGRKRAGLMLPSRACKHKFPQKRRGLHGSIKAKPANYSVGEMETVDCLVLVKKM